MQCGAFLRVATTSFRVVSMDRALPALTIHGWTRRIQTLYCAFFSVALVYAWVLRFNDDIQATVHEHGLVCVLARTLVDLVGSPK